MSCKPTSKFNFRDQDELQEIDPLCPDNACGIFRAQAQRSGYDLRNISRQNENLSNINQSLFDHVPDTYKVSMNFRENNNLPSFGGESPCDAECLEGSDMSTCYGCIRGLCSEPKGRHQFKDWPRFRVCPSAGVCDTVGNCNPDDAAKELCKTVGSISRTYGRGNIATSQALKNFRTGIGCQSQCGFGNPSTYGKADPPSQRMKRRARAYNIHYECPSFPPGSENEPVWD